MIKIHTSRPAKFSNNRLLIWFPYCLLALAVASIGATLRITDIDWQNLMFGKVQHIRLAGDYHHIDRLEIERLLSPFIGQHLSQSDLHALEYSLRAMPWIRKVVIQRVWSDTLVIHLQEREPVAYWGKNALLDANGELFVPSLVGDDKLPVFEASPGREKQLLVFYRLLQDSLSSVGLQLSALTETSNRAYIVKLKNAPFLHLGRRFMQARLNRFITAYQGGFDQYIEKAACIDLRYPNGFAVRWRNQAGEPSC